MPLLRLNGEGTRTFLHGQTTSDLLGLKAGSLAHGCWLNTAGRVRAILEIRIRENGADIVVLGGDIDDVIRGFQNAIFPADCVQLEKTQKIRRLQELSVGKLNRLETFYGLRLTRHCLTNLINLI